MWRIDRELRFSDLNFIGVDPGTTHIGLAWTISSQIYVAQVFLERAVDPIDRMCCIDILLREAIPSPARFRTIVIEGASYGDRYRQVELAECRATVVWWAIHGEKGNARIVPPKTIRKRVFGSALLKAQDVWESEIPHDALAALSCLYYGYLINEDSKKYQRKMLEDSIISDPLDDGTDF